MAHPDEEIEIIAKDGVELCYVVRAGFQPQETQFITRPEHKQQVGFIKYPEGSRIARHVHLPLNRSLVGTSEAVLVRSGRCVLEVYTDTHELVATREIACGDLVLMVAGGHGFEVLEDTVLLEVKQGPYLGLDEKERF